MNDESEKNIGIAFLLNFGFSIVELVGGLITNSYSIVSDSFHDFMDCVLLLIFLISAKSISL